MFVVADMLYFNGRYVWETHTFAQRSQWIRNLLHAFHTQELGRLVHKDDMDPVPIRGWEYYNGSAGQQGVYLPLPPMVPMRWSPTEHPDIWVTKQGATFTARTLEERTRLLKNPVVPSRILEDGTAEILV